MRRHAFNRGEQKLAEQRALLAALSNDLALPLVQIKTSLDLMGQDEPTASEVKQGVRSISLSVEAGLKLVEAYQLALSGREAMQNHLEPVSIGAVLNDVAHELSPYARQYSTELIVDVSGRFTPVLAHRQSLTAAMQCLGASMVRAQVSHIEQDNYQLVLGAHRGPEKVISTGVFSRINNITDKTLREARRLSGQAHQPLANMPGGSAGGVLIADLICSYMWQPLKPATHRHLYGLATSIPLSKQLQFV